MATGGPLFANSQRRERFTSLSPHLFPELLLRSRTSTAQVQPYYYTGIVAVS
jgi:hypothetical protein